MRRRDLSNSHIATPVRSTSTDFFPSSFEVPNWQSCAFELRSTSFNLIQESDWRVGSQSVRNRSTHHQQRLSSFVVLTFELVNSILVRFQFVYHLLFVQSFSPINLVFHWLSIIVCFVSSFKKFRLSLLRCSSKLFLSRFAHRSTQLLNKERIHFSTWTSTHHLERLHNERYWPCRYVTSKFWL